MKASSASGLCARWMVRVGLGGTRLSGGESPGLLVEGIQVLCVVGVLRPVAGALARLVRQEVTVRPARSCEIVSELDRKSTRLNSSHLVISYAVFCLKKKTQHVI